ncbi:helix-turn-helix domain-containing protein [Ancylomarina sp. YFZ004]
MEIHPLINKTTDLSITDIDHKTSYDFYKIHRHKYYEIFLFELGKGGQQLIDFNTYKIEAKTIYIVAPNQVHLLKRLKSENGILLQFTPEYLSTAIPSISADFLFAFKSNPIIKLTDDDFDSLIYSFRYLKKLGASTESLKDEKLRHFFSFTIYQILGILENENIDSKKDSLTLQFLKLAENQFSNLRNIGAYANMLHVSNTKLSASIRKDLGKTPLQILHDLLTVEIKRLIIIEQLSHKEISHRLHFDSQSSYSRFVYKQLACNPSDLSKSLEIHK